MSLHVVDFGIALCAFSSQFISADVLGSILGDFGGSVTNFALDQRALHLLSSATNILLSMNNNDLS
jgi:hypothetical protein